MLELTSYTTEDRVIEIPSLVQLSDIVAVAVRDAPLAGFVEVATECLNKGDLAERVGTLCDISTARSQ